MAGERTGGGDPRRTIELLWGGTGRQPRGPRPRFDLDGIRTAAIALADEEGLAAVTMRALARRLGLNSPMALYTYVPGKGELIDVMVDACLAEFALDAAAVPPSIPERVRAIADANRALYRSHAWLAEVSLDRPPLGPGQLRKYELELGALDGLGLSDRDMDLALSLTLAFVRAHGMSAAAAASTADEAAWWAAAGPALAERVDPGAYPLAARIGASAGEAQGRAHDPDAAYAFGVERIAAGIAAL